ncbi:DUF4145 domain-containing protein [Shewanella baltica]|uniref:DUF4145 domain-containing protein n=1 Tax=Shewanella baltica TaxID=62322 RepID=UPI000DFC9511|nr:DUF4145 domain-containing protein [Shewanella baltica]MCS6135976.1 DUF4145 domain-containing protein [Shewanella baltica]SUI87266.1 Uncharacterised protein [Shewanella baltica]
MGKITKKYKLEETSDEKFKFICNECARETSHVVVASYHESGFDDAGNNCYADWDERNQIIQCQGCDTISFRVELTHSEDSDYSYEHDTHIRNIRENYFPNRTHQLREINTFLLPINVKEIYQETTSAISNGLFILAGIGVRALIEAVCKEQKAKGGNLYDKIDSLYKMSVVTKEGSETLQKLRNLGNKAAHEVKPQSEEQLYTAMQIIDHMLEGTYIIPKRVEQVFGQEG